MNKWILKIKDGFTLIELLVVISIISILVAIGSVSYSKTMKMSRDSRRKADIEQIRQALETYRSEHGEYPDNLDTLTTENYIESIPTDPKTNDDYAYDKADATRYRIQTTLETDGSLYQVGQP